MRLSAPPSEHWMSHLMRGVAKVLLTVAIVLAVLTVLFFIVYGNSTLRHHSHTNHGSMVFPVRPR
jgi:Na+-transporting methylmalonyl-CoA/oxaloacetate decarboxylase gamma subunit